MIDLMPPEVPIGNLEPVTVKKQGFFERLFSKKSNPSIDAAPLTIADLPSLDISNSTLPELPPFESTDSKADIKPLDWNVPISGQQDLIAHSNRNNSDIDTLISKAKKQVEEEKKIMNLQTALTSNEHLDAVSQNPIIPENHTDLVDNPEEDKLKLVQVSMSETANIVSDMPAMSSDQHEEFTKIDRDHENLRNKLEKKMQKPAMKNAELRELFKQYDDKIESKIERKQMEFSRKSKKLNALHELLVKQEKQLKSGHSNLKKLNEQLKKKEVMLNEIVTNAVNKQLAKRTTKERAMLKREVSRTMALNKSMKVKLDLLERDRLAFDKKKSQILKKEQVNLGTAQSFYEKKLADLDIEKRTLDLDRKEFEQKKSVAMELLKKSDTISGELNQIQKLKDVVSKSSSKMTQELAEDKELKKAIDDANKRLENEKGNLDNMILAKYITNKFQNMDISAPADTGFSNQARQIYDQIKQCKDRLLRHDIESAKTAYNDIKRNFENSKLKNIEKSMLYNSIRALYSEIQLSLVETRLN